jgi:CspA family cold shock protein
MRFYEESKTRISNQSQLVVCQRCGRGFILTDTYLGLLKRKGAKVVFPVQCPTCYFADGPLPKHRGEVKWFNSHKRYGFIATDGGEEAFFHQKQLLEDDGQAPREGQTVRFHLHFPRKGPEALNVELIES